MDTKKIIKAAGIVVLVAIPFGLTVAASLYGLNKLKNHQKNKTKNKKT